jgi:hypothetical protein
MPGKKAGFGSPQKEAGDIELSLVWHLSISLPALTKQDRVDLMRVDLV